MIELNLLNRYNNTWFKANTNSKYIYTTTFTIKTIGYIESLTLSCRCLYASFNNTISWFYKPYDDNLDLIINKSSIMLFFVKPSYPGIICRSWRVTTFDPFVYSLEIKNTQPIPYKFLNYTETVTDILSDIMKIDVICRINEFFFKNQKDYYIQAARAFDFELKLQKFKDDPILIPTGAPNDLMDYIIALYEREFRELGLIELTDDIYDVLVVLNLTLLKYNIPDVPSI